MCIRDSYTASESIFHNYHFVTYNGFWFSYFIKCFGIELKDKYKQHVNYIALRYQENEFLDGLHRSENKKIFVVMFHYPNQLLLTNENYLYTERANRTKYGMYLKITGTEVFNRRSKRDLQCINKPEGYDNRVLGHYMKSIGCRAPYQSLHTHLPVCSTKEEIQKIGYDASTSTNTYHPNPCQSMPKIDFDHTIIDPEEDEEWFKLEVGYPKQLKIITQSKVLDVHALVGNIGGYIGLFLGKFAELMSGCEITLPIRKYVNGIFITNYVFVYLWC